MGILFFLQPQLKAEKLEFSGGTVLVYDSTAGGEKSQLIIRLARFQPDIVLEWENLSYQGTIHFFKNAVQKARALTVSEPFDPGIDGEFPDRIAKWLPVKVYERLAAGSETKIQLNGIPAVLKPVGRESATVVVNKQSIEVPVLLLEDNRRGRWAFQDDASNPVLIRYETPYFLESLARVSTPETPSLRWIKKLPPIK